jgi:pimeloyl-ACP methyl ester carboxylesterase
MPLIRAEIVLDVARGQLAASVIAPPAQALAPRPIVFVCVPGMTYRRGYWDMQVDDDGYSFAEHVTARGHVVVALDNLGVGDSPPPADDEEVDLAALGRAVAEASATITGRVAGGTLAPGLDALPAPRMIGVGHSMGGGVAMAAQALAAPWTAVAGLGYTTQALEGIYEPAPNEAELTFEERRTWARAHIPQKLWGRAWDDLDPFFTLDRAGFHGLFYGPEVPASVIAADTAAATTSPRQAALDVITPLLGARFAREVRAPVLLAYGDTDLSPDPRGEVAIYAACPDITLVLLEATAHCHNVAGSRAVLWDRLCGWAEGLA